MDKKPERSDAIATWGRAVGTIGVVFVLVWGLRGCYDSGVKSDMLRYQIELQRYEFNVEHGLNKK